MVLIKALRGGVLCINDEGENGEFGAGQAHEGVCQKRGSQTFALMITVDGEPSQERGGDYRIPREFFRDLGWKLVEQNAGGRQCVVTSDLVRIDFDRNKASRNAATDVLGRLLAKVAVERF